MAGRAQRLTPAGDFDYEAQGSGYARLRRTDPRLARSVHAALGGAQSVLNVGAGAGSYEPEDRYVVAVEPSAAMRAQRPAGRPAVDAVAERLPFDDGSFDAAMAMITVHQWQDLEAGLRELRRVARDRVLVLTFDPDALLDFWLADYVPELLEAERPRMPAIERIAAAPGGSVEVSSPPIPHDCVDGFIEAYYARPEAFLDPSVRAAQSAWAHTRVDVEPGLRRLADDLASGAWDARYGALRQRPEYVGSLRLVATSS
ncbi:methyltransferase domain-containing protein [Solirubrobacter phytolaccae]|uniref:Methyltransferase domain-containing protein n=1 Tax=Solirubrobacter phytolaccae TaxID=1404360 RepID=A0A9X3N6Z2_9ACTN|nr:class I SAM-dependent methyltransferase [Solirubrobacter phytolaccae]MDA0180631.1 methyltransferase domain-containing protein [Solirubrobacter phytolaccae]